MRKAHFIKLVFHRKTISSPPPAPRNLNMRIHRGVPRFADTRKPIKTQPNFLAKGAHASIIFIASASIPPQGQRPVRAAHYINWFSAGKPYPSRTTNHEPRSLERDCAVACRDEANPRIPIETQPNFPAKGAHASFTFIDYASIHPRGQRPVRKAHYINWFSAGKPYPSRTPHPAPRNLDMRSKRGMPR